MSQFLDLIQLIQLKVSVYHNARVCGNWQINEHSLGDTCFHIATQGSCFLDVPNIGSWTLNQGDLVVFAREIAHSMTPAIPLNGEQQHLPIAKSQHVTGTSMLCGKVQFNHQAIKTILASLPDVFVIRLDENTQWLSNMLTMITTESLQTLQPTNAMLDRLCELLFSYALRHFAENEIKDNSFLALYCDQKLTPAIESIHKQPENNWQLETLAQQCLMSRTQFSKRFKTVSGLTVMQYLTWWRMQMAWSYLTQGQHVATVAEKVGYASEATFSRAFSKEFDVSAGVVRRGLYQKVNA